MSSRDTVSVVQLSNSPMTFMNVIDNIAEYGTAVHTVSHEALDQVVVLFKNGSQLLFCHFRSRKHMEDYIKVNKMEEYEIVFREGATFKK